MGIGGADFLSLGTEDARLRPMFQGEFPDFSSNEKLRGVWGRVFPRPAARRGKPTDASRKSTDSS
jgi:hypothetical protein